MTVVNGIPNLDAVEPSLFRGGQPDECGWDWLKKAVVQTVIKLNTEAEGSEAQAEALGFKVVRFPIPWWRQTILRPRSCDLHTAVGLITTRVAPLFIHCGSDARTASPDAAEDNTQGGEDRTGLLVGCFRLTQGWTKEAAYAEMLTHGFHPILQGLQGCWEAQRPEDWVKP